MKKVLKGFLIGIAGICLTGCGSSIPEMTGEQQELVVEYATSTLLKYDKNHVVKLVTLEEEELEAEPEPLAVPEKEQTTNEEKPEDKGGVKEDDVTVIDQAEETVTIEQFLGVSDVEISYTGYETTDSYPSDSVDEVYFFMNATGNNQLLVLKFDLKNIAAGEQAIDLAASQVRYKITVNSVTQNALTTMLLNDMAYYQGTLAAGESAEVVVVGEITPEQVTQIDTLELVMKSVDDTATISLD